MNNKPEAPVYPKPDPPKKKIALVSNWRKALTMYSVQASIVLIILEWGNNFFVEWPDSPQQWAQGFFVLLLPIVRLLHQKGVSDD
jgi:hypothetical protein